MRRFITNFITVYLLFSCMQAFPLAPVSHTENILNETGSILRIQAFLQTAAENVNKQLGANTVTFSFLFGSPLILQENGCIRLEHLNDLDIIIFINPSLYSRTKTDPGFVTNILNIFRDTLKSELIFRTKQLDLIPRFINRAMFKVFFRQYLDEACSKLKQNQIMLDGKWITANTPYFTEKFIKRSLEQLFFREGDSKQFREYRQRFLNAKTEREKEILKNEIYYTLHKNAYGSDEIVFNDPLEILSFLNDRFSESEAELLTQALQPEKITEHSS